VPPYKTSPSQIEVGQHFGLLRPGSRRALIEDLNPVFRASRYGYVSVSRAWGRLTAVKDLGIVARSPKSRPVHWVHCQCDCGTAADARLNTLRRGDTRSCGCLRRERTRELNLTVRPTHGAQRPGSPDHRLYMTWIDMRRRCQDPNNLSYQRYGGRGICVCEEWKEFPAFRDWSKANGYRDDLTIDRRDNNGPYAPWNCRWATDSQQARNRRSNQYAEAWGERKLLIEWSEDPRCMVSLGTLRNRITRYGWGAERAIGTKARGRAARCR